MIRETKSLPISPGDLQLTAQLHMILCQKMLQQILEGFLFICILSTQQCQSWQLKRLHFPNSYF